MKQLSWFFVFILSSCTSTIQHAGTIAETGGLYPAQYKTKFYTLQSYYRHSADHKPLMVLIEGDGKAYLNRTTISPNPTPQHPIALQLAAKSRHANVLYLARPCQFVDVNQAPHCTPKVWTTHRYNQTVVDATHDALKLHLKHHPAQGIHFVGFSGGALIAASLATSRADTLSLQTVAGNLDVQAFTTHHNISPLPNSVQLNKAFNTLKNIPQIHFTGGADKVIPTHLIAHFLTTFKHNKHCIQHINIPGANHQTLWEKITLDFSHSTQCRSEQSVESL